MTSSARASRVGGISRPSAFAVLRLMTSSCRLKDSRCDKRPANPEAEIVDPLSDGARIAERGAETIRREVPGSATVHTVCAIAAFDPGRTIRWRAIVIAVEAILDPLKDIADHVIEAERIGLE